MTCTTGFAECLLFLDAPHRTLYRSSRIAPRQTGQDDLPVPVCARSTVRRPRGQSRAPSSSASGGSDRSGRRRLVALDVTLCPVPLRSLNAGVATEQTLGDAPQLGGFSFFLCPLQLTAGPSFSPRLSHTWRTLRLLIHPLSSLCVLLLLLSVAVITLRSRPASDRDRLRSHVREHQAIYSVR